MLGAVLGLAEVFNQLPSPPAADAVQVVQNSGLFSEAVHTF